MKNEDSDSYKALLKTEKMAAQDSDPSATFKVYAKASERFDSRELVSIGDRINFNLRKSIAISFNSTSSTNKLYNPVFSKHYVFTTANVKWV